MQTIDQTALQQQLAALDGQRLYVHLETTQGAYTKNTTGGFARNVVIELVQGKVAGQGPFRVGLKTSHGWVFAEGLTHWHLDGEGRLLLAGHDDEGHLTIALQLSRRPFPMEGQELD